MRIKTSSFRLISFTFLITLSAFLIGCSGDDKKAAQQPQRPVPMKVIKAETKDMPYWGEFVGQITAVETVDIRARVAGFLLEKRFDEGRRVKKGEVLFIIDPKPFQEDLKQAESGLEYNQALLNKAEKDFERFKKLYEEGVVSRDEFEGYQTQMTTYRAQVRDNQAKVESARLELGYTTIVSPIDGVVGRVQVNVGNLVGQGENTLLATISSVDPIYVNFSVSESDYVRAQRNKDLRSEDDKEIKLILADGSEYEYEGEFSMVDRAIDSRTGTLGIRTSFPNPDKLLRPGQYAKVRVLIEQVKDATVVPTRGIVDVQGMKSLYIVGEDGEVKSQPVKLGFAVKDLTVVTEGLKAGDLVIVDGLRRVRPKMTIKPIIVPMGKQEAQPASMGKPAATDGDKAQTEEQDG